MMETDDRTDRHIAYMRGLELLEKSGSLMIFPEGARNYTTNKPVMRLYQGTARMAIRHNVSIVPVAIEQYDRKFVINFGDAVLPDNYNSSEELTQIIRDSFATLKWEIWEKEIPLVRSELGANSEELFLKEQEERMKPWDTIETVERTRYRLKDE